MHCVARIFILRDHTPSVFVPGDFSAFQLRGQYGVVEHLTHQAGMEKGRASHSPPHPPVKTILPVPFAVHVAFCRCNSQKLSAYWPFD